MKRTRGSHCDGGEEQVVGPEVDVDAEGPDTANTKKTCYDVFLKEAHSSQQATKVLRDQARHRSESGYTCAL